MYILTWVSVCSLEVDIKAVDEELVAPHTHVHSGFKTIALGVNQLVSPSVQWSRFQAHASVVFNVANRVS